MAIKVVTAKPKWLHEVKRVVEKTAKTANCSEIEIISAMQTASAKVKDEQTLEILCELKREYIP